MAGVKLLGIVEALEDVRKVFFTDAHAGVGHAQRHCGAFVSWQDGAVERDAASVGGELE